MEEGNFDQRWTVIGSSRENSIFKIQGRWATTLVGFPRYREREREGERKRGAFVSSRWSFKTRVIYNPGHRSSIVIDLSVVNFLTQLPGWLTADPLPSSKVRIERFCARTTDSAPLKESSYDFPRGILRKRERKNWCHSPKITRTNK